METWRLKWCTAWTDLVIALASGSLAVEAEMIHNVVDFLKDQRCLCYLRSVHPEMRPRRARVLAVRLLK